jgi:hypothetical protein
MKKILFIYYRPHYFDIANYPFFHKLVEELYTSAEISLLDMSNSSMNDLSYGIKHHYAYRNKLFNIAGLRRLNIYIFKLLVLLRITKTRFDQIIVLGGNSIDAIPLIRKYSKAKLTYIDDEFPWIFRNDMDHIQECLSGVDLIMAFDEPRKTTLLNTLNLNDSIKVCIAPNIPSTKQLTVANIDWVEKLKLDPNKKYILFHGSLGQKCQLPEILCTLPLWNKNYDLIIIGWQDKYYELYRHLLTDRVTLYKGRLTDQEYSSLIKFCYATLGLYSMYIDRDQVGMSSGRVLRSVLLGVSVIANDYPAMNYVTDLGAGVQVKSVLDIPAILDNELPGSNSLSEITKQLDSYYSKFKSELLG